MKVNRATTALKSIWTQIRNRPLVWDTVTTTGWITAGRAAGFLIPFFIAAWFGVNAETDAFFFAYGIILFLSGLLTHVGESVIVPYIVGARTRNEDVGRFVGRVLGVIGVALLGLVAIFILVSKPALAVVTRFDEDALNLVYRLLIETAPLVILLVWSSVLAGALNAYKRFVIPAVSPAFRTGVTVLVILIFRNRFGVHAIVWGYIVGEIVRLVVLAAAIKRFNLFRLGVSLRPNPELWEFLKISSYQTGGMLALGLNPIIDKAMGSWLGEGSVSVLYYADRLYMVPVTLMTAGMTVTLLSHWSGRYYEYGYQRLRQDVRKAVTAVGLVALAVMLVLIFLKQPIVALALKRGTFPLQRLPEVGRVWLCYLVGLVPYTLAQVFVRGHLTLRNTRPLLKCAVFMVALKVPLNYILMKPFKVAGIALAGAFVFVFALLYLGTVFFKEVEEEPKP